MRMYYREYPAKEIDLACEKAGEIFKKYKVVSLSRRKGIDGKFICISANGLLKKIPN